MVEDFNTFKRLWALVPNAAASTLKQDANQHGFCLQLRRSRLRVPPAVVALTRQAGVALAVQYRLSVFDGTTRSIVGRTHTTPLLEIVDLQNGYIEAGGAVVYLVSTIQDVAAMAIVEAVVVARRVDTGSVLGDYGCGWCALTLFAPGRATLDVSDDGAGTEPPADAQLFTGSPRLLVSTPRHDATTAPAVASLPSIAGAKVLYHLHGHRGLLAMRHLIPVGVFFGPQTPIPGLAMVPLSARVCDPRPLSEEEQAAAWDGFEMTTTHAAGAAAMRVRAPAGTTLWLPVLAGTLPRSLRPQPPALALATQLSFRGVRLAVPGDLEGRLRATLASARELELGVPQGTIASVPDRLKIVARTLTFTLHNGHRVVASAKVAVGPQWAVPDAAPPTTAAAAAAGATAGAAATVAGMLEAAADKLIMMGAHGGAGVPPTPATPGALASSGTVLMGAEAPAVVLRGYVPHPLFAVVVKLDVSILEPTSAAFGLTNRPLPAPATTDDEEGAGAGPASGGAGVADGTVTGGGAAPVPAGALAAAAPGLAAASGAGGFWTPAALEQRRVVTVAQLTYAPATWRGDGGGSGSSDPTTPPRPSLHLATRSTKRDPGLEVTYTRRPFEVALQPVNPHLTRQLTSMPGGAGRSTSGAPTALQLHGVQVGEGVPVADSLGASPIADVLRSALTTSDAASAGGRVVLGCSVTVAPLQPQAPESARPVVAATASALASAGGAGAASPAAGAAAAGTDMRTSSFGFTPAPAPALPAPAAPVTAVADDASAEDDDEAEGSGEDDVDDAEEEEEEEASAAGSEEDAGSDTQVTTTAPAVVAAASSASDEQVMDVEDDGEDEDEEEEAEASESHESADSGASAPAAAQPALPTRPATPPPPAAPVTIAEKPGPVTPPHIRRRRHSSTTTADSAADATAAGQAPAPARPQQPPAAAADDVSSPESVRSDDYDDAAGGGGGGGAAGIQWGAAPRPGASGRPPRGTGISGPRGERMRRDFSSFHTDADVIDASPRAGPDNLQYGHQPYGGGGYLPPHRYGLPSPSVAAAAYSSSLGSPVAGYGYGSTVPVPHAGRDGAFLLGNGLHTPSGSHSAASSVYNTPLRAGYGQVAPQLPYPPGGIDAMQYSASGAIGLVASQYPGMPPPGPTDGGVDGMLAAVLGLPLHAAGGVTDDTDGGALDRPTAPAAAGLVAPAGSTTPVRVSTVAPPIDLPAPALSNRSPARLGGLLTSSSSTSSASGAVDGHPLPRAAVVRLVRFGLLPSTALADDMFTSLSSGAASDISVPLELSDSAAGTAVSLTFAAYTPYGASGGAGAGSSSSVPSGIRVAFQFYSAAPLVTPPLTLCPIAVAATTVATAAGAASSIAGDATSGVHARAAPGSLQTFLLQHVPVTGLPLAVSGVGLLDDVMSVSIVEGAARTLQAAGSRPAGDEGAVDATSALARPFTVRISIDPTACAPHERAALVDYMRRGTLQLNVFDAASQLPIGTVWVRLAVLLRQQRRVRLVARDFEVFSPLAASTQATGVSGPGAAGDALPSRTITSLGACSFAPRGYADSATSPRLLPTGAAVGRMTLVLKSEGFEGAGTFTDPWSTVLAAPGQRSTLPQIAGAPVPSSSAAHSGTSGYFGGAATGSHAAMTLTSAASAVGVLPPPAAMMPLAASLAAPSTKRRHRVTTVARPLTQAAPQLASFVHTAGGAGRVQRPLLGSDDTQGGSTRLALTDDTDHLFRSTTLAASLAPRSVSVERADTLTPAECRFIRRLFAAAAEAAASLAPSYGYLETRRTMLAEPLSEADVESPPGYDERVDYNAFAAFVATGALPAALSSKQRALAVASDAGEPTSGPAAHAAAIVRALVAAAPRTGDVRRPASNETVLAHAMAAFQHADDYVRRKAALFARDPSTARSSLLESDPDNEMEAASLTHGEAALVAGPAVGTGGVSAVGKDRMLVGRLRHTLALKFGVSPATGGPATDEDWDALLASVLKRDYAPLPAAATHAARCSVDVDFSAFLTGLLAGRRETAGATLRGGAATDEVLQLRPELVILRGKLQQSLAARSASASSLSSALSFDLLTAFRSADYGVAGSLRWAEFARTLQETIGVRCVTDAPSSGDVHSDVAARQAARAATMRASGAARGGDATGSSFAGPADLGGEHMDDAAREADLHLVQLYREGHKRDIMHAILRETVTTAVAIYPCFGRAVFFEQTIRNPYDHEERFIVRVDDPANELAVVTDEGHWALLQARAAPACPDVGAPTLPAVAAAARARFLAFAVFSGGPAGVTGSTTDGFGAGTSTLAAAPAVASGGRDGRLLELVLPPGELVTIPFVCRSMACAVAGVADGGGSGAGITIDVADDATGAAAVVPVPSLLDNDALAGVVMPTPRDATVSVVSTGHGQTVCLLRVNVRPRSGVIHRTLRLVAPEHEYLRTRIALPPMPSPFSPTSRHALPGAAVAAVGPFALIPEPDVVAAVEDEAIAGHPAGEIVRRSISVKYLVPGSRSRGCFHVLLYSDPYGVGLEEAWRVVVEPRMWVDVHTLAGQATAAELLVRESTSSILSSARRVRVATSHPAEVRPVRPGAFPLLPGTLNQVQVVVQPLTAADRTTLVNLVDDNTAEPVAAWLLHAHNVLPPVSKTYPLTCPVGVQSLKKIPFTNAWDAPRTFTLLSSDVSVVQVRSPSVPIAARGTGYFRIAIGPVAAIGCSDVYLYVNDEAGRSEEVLLLQVTTV